MKTNFRVASSSEMSRKHDIHEDSLGPVTESRQQSQTENFPLSIPNFQAIYFIAHNSPLFIGSVNWHGRRCSSSSIQTSLPVSDSLKARQVDGNRKGRELSVMLPWKKSVHLTLDDMTKALWW